MKQANKNNYWWILTLVLIIVGVGIYYYQISKTNQQTLSNSKLFVERNNYQLYSDESFQKALNNGRTILFFAATSWCSTCAELDQAIKENYSKLPQDVTILQVDYDHDKEMKSKYGVTMQTTLILLDQNGNEIKRWVSGDFNRLLSELNN